MVGNNLPTEGKIYCEQLNKQVCHVYNPDTDGQIYNPAKHGASVYRTTHDVDPKNVLPLREQINKYIKLKAFQATLFLIGFLVGFFCLYLGSGVERHYIYAHIFTWAFLFLGVCSTIATVLLYRGNKNQDKKLLNAFLSVGFLSYSWFDYYAGGFNVVRRRIAELMPKGSGNPDIAPSSYPNPVPVV